MIITGNEAVSIALIISIASIICTVYTTVSGTKKRQKEDIESEIERRTAMREEFVKVNLKLDTFCRQLEIMLTKLDKTDERLNNHEKRIGILEAQVNNCNGRQTE